MNKDKRKTNNASRQVHAGTFLKDIFKTWLGNVGTLEHWKPGIVGYLNIIFNGFLGHRKAKPIENQCKLMNALDSTSSADQRGP